MANVKKSSKEAASATDSATMTITNALAALRMDEA